MATDGRARQWKAAPRWSGSGERRCVRRRQFPAAAHVTHARAKVKLPEVLEASFGVRLRRGWCLRLHLDDRNTMVALDARY